MEEQNDVAALARAASEDSLAPKRTSYTTQQQKSTTTAVDPPHPPPDFVQSDARSSVAAKKWKTVTNVLRATRKIIPSSHSDGNSSTAELGNGKAQISKSSSSSLINRSERRYSMARRDSLLEKLSVPMQNFSDEEDPLNKHLQGKRRFTFSRGIPINGSDDEKFSSHRCYKVVINPESKVLFFWLGLVTSAWLYNIWSLIVRQAFYELRESSPGIWFAIDYLCVGIFMADIPVQLRTGFLDNGLLVFNTRKLLKNYIFSKAFLLDVFSLFPGDLVYSLITGNSVTAQPLCFASRFLKAYRAKKFYRKMESVTSYPNMWRVLTLCHAMMLLMHWFACFYYMISEFEQFKTSPDGTRGWAYPLKVLGKANDTEDDWGRLRRKYLHSIYWSCLTLTTIGEKHSPNTDVQYVCTLLAYFLGIFAFATVVGQVGNVIANKNTERLEYEKMVDQAKTFMKAKSIPNEMQNRVLRWYDYSWKHGTIRGINDVSNLGMMPETLKVELAIHMNLNTLRKVSIFRLVQPEFLYHLVLHLKSFIFTPGDLVCRQGEVAREMYIINHGVLEVVSDSGAIIAQLNSGDFFGEIGILNYEKGFNKRMANVRSVGYSEVFSLSREHVLQAMEYYPEAKDLLLLYGRQRLLKSSHKMEELKLNPFSRGRRQSNLYSSNTQRRRPTPSNSNNTSTGGSSIASVMSQAGLDFLPVLETLYDVKEEEAEKGPPKHQNSVTFSDDREMNNKKTPSIPDEVFHPNPDSPGTGFKLDKNQELAVITSKYKEEIERLREEIKDKDETIETLRDDVKLLVDKLHEAMNLDTEKSGGRPSRRHPKPSSSSRRFSMMS